MAEESFQFNADIGKFKKNKIFPLEHS